MTPEIEQQIAEINKKLMLVIMVSVPGCLIFSLGLFGIMIPNNEGILTFLNNSMIIYSMLGFGGVVMVWTVIQVIRLGNKKTSYYTNRNK